MLLVQLTAVLTSAAIIGGWLHSTALDTDNYVAVVGPLAGQPDVLDAVAGWVAGEVVGAAEQRSGVELGDDVDERAAEAARESLSSEQIAGVWVSAHTNAHGAFVALLRGEEHPALDARDGQVRLDLRPVVGDALGEITEATPELGIGPVAVGAPAETVSDALGDTEAGQVTLWRSEQLSWLQGIVRFLDRVAELLPVAAVAAAVAALALSPRRPATARLLAISIGFFAGGVLLIALGLRFLTGTVIGDPWGQVVGPSMSALTDGLVLRAGVATAVAAGLLVLGVVTGFFGAVSRR